MIKKKKGGLWWKIAIPVVVITAAAAVAYFMFFRQAQGLLAIRNAYTKLGGEVSTRIDGSPLKAYKLLSDSLSDGVITVDFDYRNYRNKEEAKGVAGISTRTEDREFALTADFTINGRNYDLEAYMNKERIAARTRLIGDKYYGFRYSTFKNDIRGFGRLIGLNNETMDTLSDAVDVINDAMNPKPGGGGDLSSYTNILARFARSMEIVSERTEIDSGGAIVRCTRTDIIINEDAFIKLINDLYETLEEDVSIRKQFDSDMFSRLSSMYLFSEPGMSGNSSYDSFLLELKNAIRDIERNYSGDIAISFFTGRVDRLLRLEINADTVYDGEKAGLRISLDLGASARDRWVLNVAMTDDHGRNSTKIVWDYRERANSIENSMIITPDDGDQITLSSLWLRNNGDFRLSYDDGRDKAEITGAFITDGKEFRLEVDDLLGGDAGGYLAFSITVANGAQIDSIEYINLDRWSEALIDELETIMGNFF